LIRLSHAKRSRFSTVTLSNMGNWATDPRSSTPSVDHEHVLPISMRRHGEPPEEAGRPTIMLA